MVSLIVILGWGAYHLLAAGPGGEPEGGGTDHEERQRDRGEHTLHGGLVCDQILRGLDLGLLAAEILNQAADDEGKDHATEAGSEGAGSHQLGPLTHRLGDRGSQGTVRDVDQRINESQDRVRGVGVDELHAFAEARRYSEGEEAH